MTCNAAVLCKWVCVFAPSPEPFRSASDRCAFLLTVLIYSKLAWLLTKLLLNSLTFAIIAWRQFPEEV